MKEGLISIVVPVYNADTFLSKCIDSLIHQTYQNIEIILVDDGSVDQSGSICDDYSKQDHRIIVIHQPNGGVSVARQKGLDAAKGEYVTHVDPDDWVERNAIEVMYERIKKENADILFCDFYEDNKKDSKFIKQYPTSNDNNTLITQILHYDLFFPLLWNSLIRHLFILNNHISFTPSDIHIGEDTLFICKLLKKSPKVSFCPQAFYHYNNNNASSITKQIRRDHLLSRCLMIDTLEEELGPTFKQDMYYIKKNFLFLAFSHKHFDLLTRYPEIHKKAIIQGNKYNPFKPISSSLSLALRIKPQWAYWVYRTNLALIKLYQTIKMFIKIKRKN